jgi:hypothetical protein
MDKRIKIVLVVVVFLGIVSAAFLFFAKKPAPVATAPKTIQATSEVKPLTPAPASQIQPSQSAGTQTAKLAERKSLLRSQWNQCKEKTLAATTNLFWSVQITEEIPAGGTYAKGNLDRDAAFPVHVIIKKDSQTIDKITAMLVVGKTAFLRGNCTDFAVDGSVVLEAF